MFGKVLKYIFCQKHSLLAVASITSQERHRRNLNMTFSHTADTDRTKRLSIFKPGLLSLATFQPTMSHIIPHRHQPCLQFFTIKELIIFAIARVSIFSGFLTRSTSNKSAGAQLPSCARHLGSFCFGNFSEPHRVTPFSPYHICASSFPCLSRFK